MHPAAQRVTHPTGPAPELVRVSAVRLALREEALSDPSSQPDAASAVPVLLIAEQERIRTTLEPLLAQAMPHARLTWANQCAVAPALAQELAPAIILIDDDLLHDDPMRLIRHLAHELPDTPILALVEEANLVETRQSLQAGARAVLHKPLQAEDLQAKLAQIPVRAPRPVAAAGESAVSGEPADEAGEPPLSASSREGRVIVFVAAKGGVGTTTLITNAAVALRELTGQTVAVVDAHFDAPTLDVALNILEGPTWRDALAALDNGESATDADLPGDLLTVHATGVHILPAPSPGGDPLQPTAAQVTQVLQELRRQHEWVLVDLGNPFGAATAALCDLADRILVVATPEITGLRNTRGLISSLAQREPSSGKVWLVLNRAGMPGGLRRTDIEERLQLRVRHALPDDAPPARHSLNRGVPLLVNDPQCALSHALVELAQELSAELDGAREWRPLPPPQRRGVARWVARLWGA